MASQYYNPRLAQVVGAAQSTPYVSLTPAIERGQMAFERQKQKQLKEQAAELERKKLEAEAFKNEQKRIDDTLYTVFKNREEASNKIDYAPKQIKGLTTTLLDTATKNYGKIEALIKDGKISRSEALMLQDEQVNSLIKKANGLLDNYDELITNVDNLEPSSVNSSQDLKLSRKLIAGEYILNVGPDGEYYADVIDDDNKTVINSVPLSELNKPSYISVDTEAFTTALGTLNTAMEKAAKAGKDQNIAAMEIDNALRNLKFTPEQTLSIAFDYLGKEMPEYVDKSKYLDKNGDIDINKFKGTIDEDGDGKFGEDEDLLAWTRNQLKEIGLKSYDAYRGQYKKDDDDIGLTQTQKYNESKAKERGDMLIDRLNAGVQSFIRFISPSTEFKQDVSGIVTLLSRDKNGKVIEGQKYNINTIEDREAFINDFARAKYGSGAQFDLIQDYVRKTLRNTMVEETGSSPTTKPQLP